MKTASITFLLLFLGACSSGGGGNSKPQNQAQNSSDSASSSPSVAQQTINQHYPKIAFSEVDNLKDHAEFPIGVEVEAGDAALSIFTHTNKQAVITQQFSEIVAGNLMKAPSLHPHENEFTFEDADQLVDFALANNLRVHGHTLVWYFRDDFPVMPEWMLNYQGDWDAMVHNHITEIVTHFKGRVQSWDVVNESIKGTAGQGNIATEADYEQSPFYKNMGKEFIENAFISANKADPDAILYYNDWALSHNDARLDFTLEMINDFLDRDIPIHGIGFQMHTWLSWPSEDTIKSAFEKAAATGLMVKITEMDIRQVAPPARTGLDILTPELSLKYKQRYKEIVLAYKEAVPPAQRGGISFWGLTDEDSWLQSVSTFSEWPLLFNADHTVKPAFYGVLEGLSGQ